MSKRLSSVDFYKMFNEKYRGQILLMSSYVNKRTPVKVKCAKCEYEYTMTPSTILYKNNPMKPCFNCSNPIVQCDYCGKEFRKHRKEVERTGHDYCSVDCRNRALNDARRTPSINNYRNVAFANYKHECAVCGWNEDADILEVHHIDENREHNELENLIILCPICHRKLTSKKYKLVGHIIIGV